MNVWDDDRGEQDEDWSGCGALAKRLPRAPERPGLGANALRARPRRGSPSTTSTTAGRSGSSSCGGEQGLRVPGAPAGHRPGANGIADGRTLLADPRRRGGAMNEKEHEGTVIELLLREPE